MVDLKQALIRLPAAAPTDAVATATARLNEVRARVKTCDSFEADTARFSDLSVGETGEVDVLQLAPEFQTALGPVKAGDIIGPLRSPQGLHLIAVCSKRQGGAHEPGKPEIENKLYGEELAMLAKRFLRDLHNSATIEAK